MTYTLGPLLTQGAQGSGRCTEVSSHLARCVVKKEGHLQRALGVALCFWV
jgi:hypothetical protein